jgi:hypothetical protein
MSLMTVDEAIRGALLLIGGGAAGMFTLAAPGSALWLIPAALTAGGMALTVPEVREEVLPLLSDATRHARALLPDRKAAARAAQGRPAARSAAPTGATPTPSTPGPHRRTPLRLGRRCFSILVRIDDCAANLIRPRMRWLSGRAAQAKRRLLRPPSALDPAPPWCSVRRLTPAIGAAPNW